MTTETRSLETNAAPEALWKLWSDPSTWAEWNPDVERMEVSGLVEPGKTGQMHTRGGRHHQITFTDVQPGRAFTLETRVIPGTKFAFTCRIDPRAGGATISQSITVKGPLGGIAGPMMAGQIANTFPPILQGLAKKAGDGAA
jgi:uncharacterized protein YndB with AHSA1/START domain